MSSPKGDPMFTLAHDRKVSGEITDDAASEQNLAILD